MALAIKFQDMVDRGEVRDYADLARLGYVTRARMTQIMNLLNCSRRISRKSCCFPQKERLQRSACSARSLPLSIGTSSVGGGNGYVRPQIRN